MACTQATVLAARARALAAAAHRSLPPLDLSGAEVEKRRRRRRPARRVGGARAAATCAATRRRRRRNHFAVGVGVRLPGAAGARAQGVRPSRRSRMLRAPPALTSLDLGGNAAADPRRARDAPEAAPALSVPATCRSPTSDRAAQHRVRRCAVAYADECRGSWRGHGARGAVAPDAARRHAASGRRRARRDRLVSWADAAQRRGADGGGERRGGSARRRRAAPRARATRRPRPAADACVLRAPVDADLRAGGARPASKHQLVVPACRCSAPRPGRPPPPVAPPRPPPRSALASLRATPAASRRPPPSRTAGARTDPRFPPPRMLKQVVVRRAPAPGPWRRRRGRRR